MEKFKEYDLAVERYPGDFAREVNLFLEKGWTLYGYPFIDEEGRYCQAVVK